eukprot:4076420-Prymnesium_polylepis.1
MSAVVEPKRATKRRPSEGAPAIITVVSRPGATPTVVTTAGRASTAASAASGGRGSATPAPVPAASAMPVPAPTPPPRPVATIPSSPAHNVLGKMLPDHWQPFAPAEEHLVTVTINVKGQELDPPCEADYSETFLWNARDESVSPLEYAKSIVDDEVRRCTTRTHQPPRARARQASPYTSPSAAHASPSAAHASHREQNLPASFATQIEAAIQRAIASAPPAGLPVPPPWSDAVVPIVLDVECRGHTLHDRFLWDLRSATPPEEFARQLCADLGLASDVRGRRRRQLSRRPHRGLVRVRARARERERAESERGRAGLVPAVCARTALVLLP